MTETLVIFVGCEGRFLFLLRGDEENVFSIKWAQLVLIRNVAPVLLLRSSFVFFCPNVVDGSGSGSGSRSGFYTTTMSVYFTGLLQFTYIVNI